MAEIKMTKTEKYTKVLEVLSTAETEEREMLIEFIQNEINALARKAGKAKEKAEERKTELDELAEVVLEVITAEPKTCDQVFEAIAFEGATVAKVRARLSKLVNLGYISKVEVAGTSTSGKKTTHKAYFKESADAAGDEE